MKGAEANDAHRSLRAQKRTWSRGVSSITINGAYGISDLTLNFYPTINAIAGTNGTGKTRILNALKTSLDAGQNTEHEGVTITLTPNFDFNCKAIEISSSDKTELYRPYFCS